MSFLIFIVFAIMLFAGKIALKLFAGKIALKLFEGKIAYNLFVSFITGFFALNLFEVCDLFPV